MTFQESVEVFNKVIALGAILFGLLGLGWGYIEWKSNNEDP